MAQAAENVQMLNSWKEIASFLDRGVRTVQRWERDLRLPVHRIGKGRRSPVYALVPELKFWIATSGVDSKHVARPVLVPPNGKARAATPIETSRRLMEQSLKLVQSVAETSVRQQRQAELLQQRILKMKERMR